VKAPFHLLSRNKDSQAATTMYLVETNHPVPLPERTARTSGKDSGN
jgi:hypothetical protein